MLQPEPVAPLTWADEPRRRVLRIEEIEMADDVCDDLISEDFKTLDCDLEVSKGLEELDSAGVTSAPVVDDNGILIGVVFLATLARLRTEEDVEVEDAMITNMVTVSQHASVAEVARLMAQHHVE